jgi:glyoxylase-like metal-dependent hydrolase (beta-lactamase superfamily II)
MMAPSLGAKFFGKPRPSGPIIRWKNLAGLAQALSRFVEQAVRSWTVMPTESLAELVRFAPDVYGFRWVNHVAMFVVTNAGVVLVDANGQVNPRTPDLIKEAIRSVTPQPVRYFVYSHSAFDHSTGGAVFADTARFVGHANTVERIKAAKDPTTPAPDIVFDRKISLELGGRSIDLYPADLSPTDDYIVVHDPAGRVAMFVDLVQPRNLPFRTLLGHPERIVERFQWIEDTLDFDVIVSGHATPQMSGTKQDVVEQRRYYGDLSDAIATARATGLADGSSAMTTLVRSLLHPKYGAWRRFDEFLALNIEGMIAWRAGKSPAAH